jgi:hypothetical protein
MLASCSGCLCLGCQSCEKYQDVALVALPLATDIDSVVMKANDSIIGCGNSKFKVVGSKTHSVQFPINVRIQFFSREDLRKEIFFEMDKNTVANVYIGIDCSDSSFINSSLDDYCWGIKKMGDYDSYEDMRCTEWNVSGKRDLCSLPYFD